MVEILADKEIEDILRGRKKINNSIIESAKISRFLINRLIEYKVIKSIGNNNYKIIGDVSLVKSSSILKEIEALKKTYAYYYNCQDYDKAYQYLIEYIKLCRENNIKGHYYYELQKTHEQQKLNMLELSNSTKARELHNKFEEYLNNKEYNEALCISYQYMECTKANNVYSYLLPAIACNRLGEDKLTEDYLNLAKELLDNSPSILLEFSKLYLRQGKFEETLENLNKLIELDGKNFTAFIMLYKTFYLSGDYKSADCCYKNIGDNLNKKMVKHFKSEVFSFHKALYYRHNEIIKQIEQISYSDIPLCDKIHKINNYVLSLKDFDTIKSLALIDSLKVIEPTVREIYRLSITEEDREFAKPYVKEYGEVEKKII